MIQSHKEKFQPQTLFYEQTYWVQLRYKTNVLGGYIWVPSLKLSVCLSVCLLSIHLSPYLPINLSIHLSINLPIYPSVIYVFIYLSTCLSIYLSIIFLSPSFLSRYIANISKPENFQKWEPILIPKHWMRDTNLQSKKTPQRARDRCGAFAKAKTHTKTLGVITKDYGKE